MSVPYIDGATVSRLLPFETCISVVAESMKDLSAGRIQSPLRQIVDLGSGSAFGTMPGAMIDAGVFGAKLMSVFPGNVATGLPAHQGVIVLFESTHGQPVAVVDAASVTHIRTAAASAAATQILARHDADKLLVIGSGAQAEAHAIALAQVRDFREIRIWGRSLAKSSALARLLAEQHGLPATAVASIEEAAAESDVICTTTSSMTPVLDHHIVRPGTHINAVGSSRLGPIEIAPELAAKARFFGDYRPSVLAQGSEFVAAKDAGLFDDDHFLGELGELIAGTTAGRVSEVDITLYKSLGHVAQDIASAWHVARAANAIPATEK